MGDISTIGLVLHPQRDCAEAHERIVAWARGRHADLLALAGEESCLVEGATAVTPQTLATRSDLVVSLGGDGTMLRALRLLIGQPAPVLGVNLGKLGFLAEIDVPELPDALTAIDEHRFTTEYRSAVQATVGDHSAAACNDIALTRFPGHHMSVIDLWVEGHSFVRYAADAVVVATPTGSTAYSFSAGGPIVSPRVEGLLVTPVAPHSAFNRSLFLSSDERLALRVLPQSGTLAMEADGQVVTQVDPGETVDLTVLPTATKVVRLGQTTFYQRAKRRLRLMGSAEADGG